MGAYGRIVEFFSGWRFPVVMISTLVFLVSGMVAIFLVPAQGSSLSDFARDFKIWCFGYNPETGSMEWSYLWLFLVQPFLMVGLVIAIWFRQLAAVLKQTPKRVVPWMIGSLLFVGLLGAGLPITAGEPADAAERPFPAESLRTHVPATQFVLTDQEGRALSLHDYKGQVILLTAAYSRCGLTCPLIMGEIRRIVNDEAVTQPNDLVSIVITLDPAHDSPEIMGDLIDLHGLSENRVFGLSGSEKHVADVLDRYGFTRWVDEATGAIGHTNSFVLIDRKGYIAYRFALGKQQERWIKEALQLLLDERV